MPSSALHCLTAPRRSDVSLEVVSVPRPLTRLCEPVACPVACPRDDHDVLQLLAKKKHQTEQLTLALVRACPRSSFDCGALALAHGDGKLELVSFSAATGPVEAWLAL